MKRLPQLIVLSALLLSFFSCDKDEQQDEAWIAANDKAYNDIVGNPDFKELKTETGPAGVYYKVKKKGDGVEHPIQTSSVKVLYKGTYYDGTVFDSGTGNTGIPREFSTEGTVRGFSFALQNMVVGDRWEIWIPYYLGYGSSGMTDYYGTVLIKGYATLFFDVELVSITQYPYSK
jgi:FKBP-type peptidyl-prolyl cis-trans isomerase